jgi:putative glycosyltransferase
MGTAEQPAAQRSSPGDRLSAPDAGTPPTAISIISTMYRSRSFLDQFLNDCLAALSGIGCSDFEIILVNDGSPDDSLQYAIERRSHIPQLVVVDLSRNFGHHAAMQAGLRQARGELLFLIDCDLEVSPKILAGFYAKLLESGADLIYGYQDARRGGWFEKLSGGLFWKGFNVLSDTQIPENIVTERIMTRRFVEALLRMGDYNLFLGGMMSWTGFTQLGLPLSKGKRSGPRAYTLPKRIQLMVNAVCSFSSKPLVWLFNMGVIITIASFSYTAYLVFRTLFFSDTLLGFTSMMAMMAMILGVLTTSLGLVGIYLGKVFTQVQNRPTYIIRNIYR